MPGAPFQKFLRQTFSLISASRKGQAGLPGDADNTLFGNAEVNSPFQYLEAFPQVYPGYYYKNQQGVVADGGTTDGTACAVFNTLNSGTVVNTSAQAGYEGMGLITTAASATAVTSIWNAGALFTAGRRGVMIGRAYFPDPNTEAYEWYMGFGNKQANPHGTAFTDGAWIQGVTATSAIQFNGKTRNNSGTATTTALTNFILASGAPQSFWYAVCLVGGATAAPSRAEFWMMDPTGVIASGNWTKFTYSTYANLPRTTVLLRPHHSLYNTYSGSVGAIALQQEAPTISIERALAY